MFSMLRIVHWAGWTPLLMAAFSAGSPKASKPMGKNTLSPFMRRKRAMGVGGRHDVPVADVQVARRDTGTSSAGSSAGRDVSVRSVWCRPSSSQRCCQRGSICGGFVADDAVAARARSAGSRARWSWRGPQVGRVRSGDGGGVGRAASGAGDPDKHERERGPRHRDGVPGVRPVSHGMAMVAHGRPSVNRGQRWIAMGLAEPRCVKLDAIAPARPLGDPLARRAA